MWISEYLEAAMLSRLRDTFSQVRCSRKDLSSILHEKYIKNSPNRDHHSKSHQLLVKGLEVGDVGISVYRQQYWITQASHCICTLTCIFTLTCPETRIRWWYFLIIRIWGSLELIKQPRCLKSIFKDMHIKFSIFKLNNYFQLMHISDYIKEICTL